MKNGLSPLSSTTATIMNHRGVRLSPAPRSAIISKVSSSSAGMREEDDAQISERERSRVAGVPSSLRIAGARNQPAIATRIVTSANEPDGGAEHPPRLVDVLAAPAWPMRIVEAMPKPNTNADQQEHDHVGVGRRGQRVLAEEAADPDRVDRAVQRLQDRGGERRQREGEQGLGDRPW